MPTFDFANIIKKLIAGVIQASCSPIVICLGFATIIGTCVNKFTDWFDSIKFNQTVSLSIDYENDLIQLVLYCINWQILQDIFETLLEFIFSSLTFICHFGISVIVAIVPTFILCVLRKSLKDWQ